MGLRIVLPVLGLIAMIAPAGATTLQRLTTGDMIRESTAIVRAKVTGSHAVRRGADIYTYYQLQVLENLKSNSARQVEVAVPGGAAGGIRQMAVGAPTLSPGREYVIFLWTGRSGMTQIIGLSQGLFGVAHTQAGDTVLMRRAASELMLDPAGKIVKDQPASMRLADLRGEIRSALGAEK